MKRYVVLFIHIAVLLILSLLFGFMGNQILPNRIAWIEDWSKRIEVLARKENISLVDYDFVLRAANEQDHILLDARPADDYNEGHIRGAFSLLASDELDDQDIFPVLVKDDALLIYCSGIECDESMMLAISLREHGFTNLVIYSGGWSEWSQREAEEL